MATRRMRIKAVINVNRGGNKTEPQQPQEQPTVTSSSENVPLSPAPVQSPRYYSGSVSPTPSSTFGNTNVDPGGETPRSPGAPPRVHTPPAYMPSSPHSPSPSTSSSWQLQRPSPSKSPACLPPSGSILRRSPSPALSRSTNSPGPPSSPIKSPIPHYGSPLSPTKHFSRSSAMVATANSNSLALTMNRTDSTYTNPMSSASPGSPVDSNVKSPSGYVFRPPPSPSSSNHYEYSSQKSPAMISRPSPAQSPVFGHNRPVSSATTSLSFLSHHFNTNSNSGDCHEVAALMSANTNSALVSPSPSVTGLFPPSPEKRISGRDSVMSIGSENACPSLHGVFSNVSNINSSPSPSFSKTIFDNPEPLKRRAEDTRKKEAAQASASKFAAARKEFFDKLQSGQTPERNKLTMLHFTFYNPPDPNKEKLPRQGKSRSRASSVCSDISTISKHEYDQNVQHPATNNENSGKALSAPSSIAGSRRTTASSVGSGGSIPASEGAHSEAGSVASNASSNGSVPGPRVKVGPDGQLIIDEKSLVVETSESQRARKQIEDMEVVSGADFAVGSSGLYRYKKNYRRGTDWTERETVRFYRALNQCGTDFSMMLKAFPTRSRQELKSKFKREDKKNPDLISKVLQSCVFDADEAISDYEDSEMDAETGKKKPKRRDSETIVVCASEDGTICGPPGAKKRKASKKKEKDMEFSKDQIKEMKTSIAKGTGTGKGKKWNTPVEGLVGGKLPSLPPGGSSQGESTEKVKRKYVRKKQPLLPKIETTESKDADGFAPSSLSDTSGATLVLVRHEVSQKEKELNKSAICR